MENFLKQYLESLYNDEYYVITIDSYYVSASECVVKFYTDDAKYYKETTSINIWKMLIFLESQKNNK